MARPAPQLASEMSADRHCKPEPNATFSTKVLTRGLAFSLFDHFPVFEIVKADSQLVLMIANLEEVARRSAYARYV